jgi:hypothetical protein
MAKRPAKPKPKPKDDHDESLPWSPESPQKHGPLRCHDGRDIRTLEHVIVLALELEIALMSLDKTVTDALAAQDAKLADLAAKVDAFIAAHQGTSAADSAAVVSALQAEGSVVDGIAAKLV